MLILATSYIKLVSNSTIPHLCFLRSLGCMPFGHGDFIVFSLPGSLESNVFDGQGYAPQIKRTHSKHFQIELINLNNFSTFLILCSRGCTDSIYDFLFSSLFKQLSCFAKQFHSVNQDLVLFI